MRTFRAGYGATALLFLATASQAEGRLVWTCMPTDGGAAREVELVYLGPDVVPCKAYDHRPNAGPVLIADYQVSAGECERRVKDLVGTLRGRGYDCPDPDGASLASLDTSGKARAAPADDNAYFAILGKQPSAEAAQAEAARLRAANPPVRAIILSPRGGTGTWLVALAAYTDAATAAKAVQFARSSGLAPDAYFWSVPRVQAGQAPAD
ncbi:MAG: SPOR domain-containing protein [Amaricoccus sp.]